MKVRHYYPLILTVDGEEIHLRIKRMDIQDALEFGKRARKLANLSSLKFFSRATSGPEQERNDKGEFKIPFERLVEQRIEQMSPKERAEYYTQAEVDEQEARQWQVWVCEQFVTVESGLLEELPDGTERSVTEGADFARIFAARIDLLQQAVAGVRRENELSLDQKKAWKSPIASSPSSNGRRPDRAGRKRGTTAGSVARGDSADSGAARAMESATSGSTATLPSGRVPSTH